MFPPQGAKSLKPFRLPKVTTRFLIELRGESRGGEVSRAWPRPIQGTQKSRKASPALRSETLDRVAGLTWTGCLVILERPGAESILNLCLLNDF